MHPLTVGLVIADPDIAKEAQASIRDLPVRIPIDQADIGEWGGFLDKLDRLLPDVVLLDITNLRDSLEDTIRRIRRTAASPAVVALHGSADPEIILKAMRSGATEFLYPPLRSGLAAALERISAERFAHRDDNTKRGKTIAAFSVKGGCGATTIACHLAVELQRQTNKRLLLADFDLDTGLIGFLMKSKSTYSVLDAVKNIHRLDLSYWKALISNGTPGLEVIRAPLSMSIRQPGDYDTLRHILTFVRSHYDWVVVDMGRSMGLNAMSSLDEVDETYLVTTLEIPALYQAKHVARTLRESAYGGDRLRVLVNRASKKSELSIQELEQMLGAPVVAVVPEDGEALYEAYADGKLAGLQTNLGKHISALASKISGVSEPKNKRKFSIFG